MKHRLAPAIVFLTLCAPLALGGCFATALQKPAPFVHYGGDQGAGATGVHTVATGETLYIIATRYRLALPDIVAENHLSPPFILRTGQRLKLPAPREYTVREGDSLYEVSRLFDTGMSDIVRLNDISPPYAVHTGQVLRLPSSAPPPVPERKPRNAQTRFFASSDQNSSGEEVPSSRFSGILSRLVGQRREALADTESGNGSATPPIPEPRPTAQSGNKATETAAALPMRIPTPPPRDSGKFSWPVRGTIISTYGPKKGGLHNDGINIKAAHGTPILAADNGVVAYAGSELQGYGNLVLIRHESRWVTAYAHMEKILVKKGQTVRKNQPIGAVGSTGSVAAPQLHFEIRRGSDALNPQAFLER